MKVGLVYSDPGKTYPFLPPYLLQLRVDTA